MFRDWGLIGLLLYIVSRPWRLVTSLAIELAVSDLLIGLETACVVFEGVLRNVDSR